MNKSIIVATFAFITNHENKVLLLRRAKHDSFPGRWELPGGGLDSGERPEESIEREVLEESGLLVRAIRPISVITHENHDNTQDIVRITYECKILDPHQEVLPTEDHDAYQWVDQDKLHSFDKNAPLYDVVKEIIGIRKTAS